MMTSIKEIFLMSSVGIGLFTTSNGVLKNELNKKLGR